jgi:hypothetical protein
VADMKRELKGNGFGNYYICYFYISYPGMDLISLLVLSFNVCRLFVFPFPLIVILKVSALVVDGVLGIFVKPWLICRHVCSCG